MIEWVLLNKEISLKGNIDYVSAHERSKKGNKTKWNRWCHKWCDTGHVTWCHTSTKPTGEFSNCWRMASKCRTLKKFSLLGEIESQGVTKGESWPTLSIRDLFLESTEPSRATFGDKTGCLCLPRLWQSQLAWQLCAWNLHQWSHA